eukprot:CAMPEP_0172408070 /NCGR_PEP_ID=MMETSP1061-20121228/75665_1 /TAXON_ID=37318 /ORGANISM="Pseudo-nitzschia pungens, Strain cf. pungens" /LENGTH=93 /DNA_ID=CAMNT_0013144187 /DNA_START=205 /DNA_END=489 /DNA_ORIENTATION=+
MCRNDGLEMDLLMGNIFVEGNSSCLGHGYNLIRPIHDYKRKMIIPWIHGHWDCDTCEVVVSEKRPSYNAVALVGRTCRNVAVAVAVAVEVCLL